MAEENNNIEELLGSEENLNKAIAIIKGKSFAVMPIKDFNEQEQINTCTSPKAFSKICIELFIF